METLKKKNSCCSKIPLPPPLITFLKVRPFITFMRAPLKTALASWAPSINIIIIIIIINHQPSEALKFNRQPSKSEKK